ncbi:metal-dependent hydrolase [Candidatus Woesearchaeota archaeon]|nr:metal-dependent hydrolase [Candidatus Woesearchaeota archaeon]
MMYKTHMAFGVLLGLIAMEYFDVNKYMFIGAAVFGSLFVDVDEASSYMGKRTWPVSNMVELFFGHRGIFHSIWMAGLIFLGFYLFGLLNIGIGFLIGYGSHLIADMMTVEGVRIFYPLSKFSIRGFARTDGIFEKIFFTLVLLAIGYRLV